MPGINKRGALTMAKDHTVLGLQLLISSSSCSPKWCVRTSVLDLLGGALLMELPFFLLIGLDMSSIMTPKLRLLLVRQNEDWHPGLESWNAFTCLCLMSKKANILMQRGRFRVSASIMCSESFGQLHKPDILILFFFISLFSVCLCIC